MKSNDKSLPLPVLLKSMTEELHITDLPEGAATQRCRLSGKGRLQKNHPRVKRQCH